MDNVLLKDAHTGSNRMCRLCLSANGVMETIGYNQGDQYILQKIYECTTIQITPLSGVPSALCTICRARLEDFYQFRWQCIKNDEIIHRIAAGLNNKLLSANVNRAPPAPTNAGDNDKRIQETAPVCSTSLPRLAGMSQQVESHLQQHGLHAVGMNAEGYPEFGPKYSNTTNAGHFVLESQGNFRRKRGRPPKQQYDFGTHSISNKQPSVVGENAETLHRPLESGWIDEQGTPSEVLRIGQEPSGSSSENQEGQDWFKIKLEQLDHQVQPTRTDHLHHIETLAQRNRQLDSVSSEQINRMLASPDSQITSGFGQMSVKRSRGRPPREGGCPNEDREEYRFRCQYCSARFKAAINLKLHTNTHTGEKPYPCTICNKSFAHPSNLSVHMKLHTNHQTAGDGVIDSSLSENGPKPSPSPQSEKKFQCPYCQTLFALAFQLKIHINTHTGQKPYVCKNCGKGFAQPSNLHVHSKKHCRRKQSQYCDMSNVTAHSSSSYTHATGNAPAAHTTETLSPSMAFGRISSHQHQGSSMSPMIADSSVRPPHLPTDIEENQRTNHLALNANTGMLV